MNRATRILILVLCCVAGSASAQQPASTPAAVPPPKPTAQSEAGEPRANTSGSTAKSPAATSPAATSPSAKSPAPPPPSGSPTKHAPGEVATVPKSAAKTDRLELGTATVTGDREQPKVMYIVPWKRSDIGDLAGKPMNSLVDEILAPVDRDVFKREVVYYGAVQAEASQNGAPPKPAQQVEK
jgi:hypothetical protein